MRAAAALLLLSLTAPSEPPLTYRTALRSGAIRDLPPVYAITFYRCNDSRARSMNADELMDRRWSLLLEVVRAHEADHRALGEGMGCAPYNAALRSRDMQLSAEVRAFCAGVRAGVRNGWFSGLPEALWSAAYDLSGAYPQLAIQFVDAHAMLSKTCGPTSTGSP